MRAVAIVLDRNRDRVLPGIAEVAGVLGLDLHVMSAVDGRDVPEVAEKLHFMGTSAAGQAGCLVSHERVVATITDEPVLVLEEDARLSGIHPDPRGAFEEAVEFAEGWGAEMLMLGGRPPKNRELKWVGPNLCLAERPTFTTHAMLIWPAGAEVLAEAYATHADCVDHLDGELMRRGRSLLRLPQLIIQDPKLPSNITTRTWAAGARHDPSVGRGITEEGCRDMWRKG